MKGEVVSAMPALLERASGQQKVLPWGTTATVVLLKEFRKTPRCQAGVLLEDEAATLRGLKRLFGSEDGDPPNLFPEGYWGQK